MDLAEVQEPSIVFISALRTDFITAGDYEKLLAPLLRENAVDISSVSEDRIILACLKRQLPSISQQLGPSVSLLSSNTLRAKAQSSLRTVSLPAPSTFRHDLKLALACNITSALRTITPWTALIGPEVSIILANTLPPDIWVCNELAAITGSAPNFDKAKHCSMLIRENLEEKARNRGETLIVSAALAERSVDDIACHAERVFELRTERRKEGWFRESVYLILLGPLITKRWYRLAATLPSSLHVPYRQSTRAESVLRGMPRIY